MNLSTTYRNIWKLSFPLMLGSAAQNIIALSDSILLYHNGELDFAAIGVVSVYYLIVAAIGYGFSKGGQIIIARRLGASEPERIGSAFHNLVGFELLLSVVLFSVLWWGSPWILGEVVNDSAIYERCLSYLDYRSFSVFFGYLGFAVIALYTGIARTNVLIAATAFMVVVNLILNYVLIFGHFGFEAMGIGGAGLASTISEAATLIVFMFYMLWDKTIAPFRIFRMPEWQGEGFSQLVHLSAPMVAQSVVGLGSWFLFFGIVDNLGAHALAITNLLRIVYLVLSVPAWGFAASINTLVSGFIGADRRRAVFPIIWKTSKMSAFLTIAISFPVMVFPKWILYPILGSNDMSLLTEAQPILWIVFGILVAFSIGVIFFNGLAGTGATWFGLLVQFICAVVYLSIVYVAVEYADSLAWAWSAELIYWLVMILISTIYLRGKRWYKFSF